MTSDSNSGNYSKETQNTNWKKYMHPYVHYRVIDNNQAIEATYGPISGWVDKKALIYLHNWTLLSHKKKEILLFMTAWIDQESIMLSEISQSEKDKYHMILLICGI